MTKILVIEDDESVRLLLEELLDINRFEVITAESGSLGLQLAIEQLPDLILCNVMMPDLSGFDVLTELRQNLATQAIPLIFISAQARRDEVRQGLELGATSYLTKPFTIQELLNTIDTALLRSTEE